MRRSGEFGRGSGEVRSNSAFPVGRSERVSEPTYRSLYRFELDDSSSEGKSRTLVGADGTVWVRIKTHPAASAQDKAVAKRRKRALNAKITYVCEAASEKSGLPAAHYAGVPERTFRRWQQKRNFFYWPADDVAEAVDERMKMNGYVRFGERNKDLLSALGEAVIEGYKLYKLAALAHGVVHAG